MNNNENSPKVAFISVHPAPYRDPVLAEMAARNNLELCVYHLFDEDAGHNVWNLRPYKYKTIETNYSLIKGRHFSLKAVLHIIKSHYDVIAIPGYYHHTCKFILLYCIVMKVPYIWMADSVSFKPANSIKKFIRRLLSTFLAARVGSVWVPGAANRNYQKMLNMPDNRIFEGAYCLDSKKIYSQTVLLKSKRDIIRKNNNVDKSICLLMVANLVEKRGISLLIEAVGEVKKIHDDIKLIIIGDGPELHKIKTVIMSEKLEGTVHIINSVPFYELIQYYVAADIYVHTCIYEEYSLALVQAAITGLPIVATNTVGAAHDYVIENETGFMADAGNPNSIAESLLKMIKNKNRFQEFGKKIQEIALRRDVKWAADQFESAVYTALNR